MTDFMKRFLDSAPDSAKCAVMQHDGTVAFFSTEKVEVSKIGVWYCEREGVSVGGLTFGDNFKHGLEHLWAESKRVRTPDGWVKA